MKKIVILFFVLLVLITFKWSHITVALSCAPSKPLQDEYNLSTTVFMGTALTSNSESLKVNFQIKTIWKGSSDSIANGIIISDMWKDIKAGQDYLMFVNNREGQSEVNLCGNSMLWSEVVQEQINEFGTGQIIEQPIAEEEISDGKNLWLIGVIIIVIGGVLTIFFRFRKQK